MQTVAWSTKQSKFNLKNRSLRDTTKACLKGPKNNLEKLQNF